MESDSAQIFADVLRARVLQKVQTRLHSDNLMAAQPASTIETTTATAGFRPASKAPRSPPTAAHQVRCATKDRGQGNKRKNLSDHARHRNRGRAAWEAVRAAEKSSQLIASLQGALEVESEARVRAEQNAGDAGLLGFDFARALKQMREILHEESSAREKAETAAQTAAKLGAQAVRQMEQHTILIAEMEDSAMLSQKAIIHLREEISRKTDLANGFRQQLTIMAQRCRELEEKISTECSARVEADRRVDEARVLGSELATKIEQLHEEYDGQVSAKHKKIADLQENLDNVVRVGNAQQSRTEDCAWGSERLMSKYPSELVPAAWLRSLQAYLQETQGSMAEEVDTCRRLLDAAKKREEVALNFVGRPQALWIQQDRAARLIQTAFHCSQSRKLKRAVGKYKQVAATHEQATSALHAAIAAESLNFSAELHQSCLESELKLAGVIEQQERSAQHYYEAARKRDAVAMVEKMRKVHDQADLVTAVAEEEICHLQQQLSETDVERIELQSKVEELRAEIVQSHRTSSVRQVWFVLTAIAIQHQMEIDTEKGDLEHEHQLFVLQQELSSNRAQVAKVASNVSQHEKALMGRASRDKHYRAATAIQTRFLRHREAQMKKVTLDYRQNAEKFQDQSTKLKNSLRETERKCDIVQTDSASLMHKLVDKENEYKKTVSTLVIQNQFLRHCNKKVLNESSAAMDLACARFEDSQRQCGQFQMDLIASQLQVLAHEATLLTIPCMNPQIGNDMHCRSESLQADMAASTLQCCMLETWCGTVMQSLLQAQQELQDAQIEQAMIRSELASLRDELLQAQKEVVAANIDTSSKSHLVDETDAAIKSAAAATVQFRFLRYRYQKLRRETKPNNNCQVRAHEELEILARNEILQEEIVESERQRMRLKLDAQYLKTDLAAQHAIRENIIKDNDTKITMLEEALTDARTSKSNDCNKPAMEYEHKIAYLEAKVASIGSQCSLWQTRAQKYESQLDLKDASWSAIFEDSQRQFEALHSQTEDAYQECLQWRLRAAEIQRSLVELLLDMGATIEMPADDCSANISEAIRTIRKLFARMQFATSNALAQQRDITVDSVKQIMLDSDLDDGEMNFSEGKTASERKEPVTSCTAENVCSSSSLSDEDMPTSLPRIQCTKNIQWQQSISCPVGSVPTIEKESNAATTIQAAHRARCARKLIFSNLNMQVLDSQQTIAAMQEELTKLRHQLNENTNATNHDAESCESMQYKNGLDANGFHVLEQQLQNKSARVNEPQTLRASRTDGTNDQVRKNISSPYAAFAEVAGPVSTSAVHSEADICKHHAMDSEHLLQEEATKANERLLQLQNEAREAVCNAKAMEVRMRLNDERVAEMEQNIRENTDLQRLQRQVQGMNSNLKRLEEENFGKTTLVTQLRQQLDLANLKLEKRNATRVARGTFEQSALEIFANLANGVKIGEKLRSGRAQNESHPDLTRGQDQAAASLSLPKSDQLIYANQSSIHSIKTLQKELEHQRVANTTLEALYTAAAAHSQQLEMCAANLHRNDIMSQTAECEELRSWLTKLDADARENFTTAEAIKLDRAKDEQRAPAILQARVYFLVELPTPTFLCSGVKDDAEKLLRSAHNREAAAWKAWLYETGEKANHFHSDNPDEFGDGALPRLGLVGLRLSSENEGVPFRQQCCVPGDGKVESTCTSTAVSQLRSGSRYRERLCRELEITQSILGAEVHERLSERAMRQVYACREALRHAGCSAADQQSLPDRIHEVEAALQSSSELPLVAYVTDERDLLEKRLRHLQQKPKLSIAEVRLQAAIRIQARFRGGLMRRAFFAAIETAIPEIAVQAVLEARARWAHVRNEITKATEIRQHLQELISRVIRRKASQQDCSNLSQAMTAVQSMFSGKHDAASVVAGLCRPFIAVASEVLTARTGRSGLVLPADNSIEASNTECQPDSNSLLRRDSLGASKLATASSRMRFVSPGHGNEGSTPLLRQSNHLRSDSMGSVGVKVLRV